MYEEINSIDFSGEMKINDLYYLYKTNSSPINLQIYSKLQNFLNSSEFFKHYMNKDINIFLDNFNNFIEQLSSLSNQNNQIKFNSKIDQYISDFSYIYLLFNIISKLNDSLISILLNTKKNNLSKLYIKYRIDKNKQEQIEECINNMLHSTPAKERCQKILSKSSTKNNSNLSIDNNYLYWNNENKANNDNNSQQILIKDLIGKEEENDFLNEINNTPKFNEIKNLNSSLSDGINNNLNNTQKNQPHNENELGLKNEKSDSEFTLFPKENNVKREKENENTLNNNLSDDINDYITNINSNFIIKSSKKRNNYYFKKYNSNINLNRYKSLDKNIKSLFSSYKGNTKSFKKLEKNDLYQKMHVSSGHLFMKDDSKMYTELLEIIIELYKGKKINEDQKLKLKKLIICKSPKILNVYKFFNHDNEKFIKELKEIIE